MGNAIVPVSSDGADKPWGRANPLRGANYVDIALAFIEDFPVGSTVLTDDFDKWIQGRGYLNVPIGAPRPSDAWKAYLQRRHELRNNINKAASHPRMETPFIIEAVAKNLWEIRPPQVAISRNKLLHQVESLVGTKRKQIGYLMQSADWSLIPPQDRAFAESLYDDLDMFHQKVTLESVCLNRKFVKLEKKLRKAIESGEIKPQNGGIKNLLAPPSKED